MQTDHIFAQFEELFHHVHVIKPSQRKHFPRPQRNKARCIDSRSIVALVSMTQLLRPGLGLRVYGWLGVWGLKGRGYGLEKYMRPWQGNCLGINKDILPGCLSGVQSLRVTAVALCVQGSA